MGGQLGSPASVKTLGPRGALSLLPKPFDVAALFPLESWEGRRPCCPPQRLPKYAEQKPAEPCRQRRAGWWAPRGPAGAPVPSPGEAVLPPALCVPAVRAGGALEILQGGLGPPHLWRKNLGL